MQENDDTECFVGFFYIFATNQEAGMCRFCWEHKGNWKVLTLNRDKASFTDFFNRVQRIR